MCTKVNNVIYRHDFFLVQWKCSDSLQEFEKAAGIIKGHTMMTAENDKESCVRERKWCA